MNKGLVLWIQKWNHTSMNWYWNSEIQNINSNVWIQIHKNSLSHFMYAMMYSCKPKIHMIIMISCTNSGSDSSLRLWLELEHGRAWGPWCQSLSRALSVPVTVTEWPGRLTPSQARACDSSGTRTSSSTWTWSSQSAPLNPGVPALAVCRCHCEPEARSPRPGPLAARCKSRLIAYVTAPAPRPGHGPPGPP